MLFRKEELKHLWPFYLEILISGLSAMINSYLILYFFKLGLSYFQISIITFGFGFSMFLFEIPTGAFADSYSRKYSVILGFIIIAISSAFIPFTNNLYYIVILWSIAGIGMTFVSGADVAWVIDNLNHQGKSALQEEYFVKMNFFNSIGLLCAPILGAVLVKIYSIKSLWFVFSVGYLLSAIVLIFFTQEHFKSAKKPSVLLIKQSYQNSKIGLSFTLRNKSVFFFLLAGLFTQLMSAGNDGEQPFLIKLGMAEYQLGLLYSIKAGVCIIAYFFSRYLRNFAFKDIISTIILIAMVLDFVLLFIHPPFFMIAAAIFIFNMGMSGLIAPKFQAYLHQYIPGKIRATVLSVNSMLTRIFMAFASLVAGICLDLFGPQKILGYAGLFGIFAVFFYQKIKS